MRRNRRSRIKQCKNCFFNDTCSSKISNCQSFYPIKPSSKKYMPNNTETTIPYKKSKIDAIKSIKLWLIIIALVILAYLFTS